MAGVGTPAVIFDFNGTLSDDEPILFRIFAEIFEAHLGWPLTAQDYAARLLGHSDREIIEKALQITGCDGRGAAGVDELLVLRAARYRELVAHENPIRPETVELVRTLAAHGVALAVVTGAQRADVAAVLAASPVGEFLDVVIAEEDVVRGKPDPEGFLAAAARLGADPAATLVFEDSVPGVRAALAAGMHCIAVAAEPGPELCTVAPAVVDRLRAGLVDQVLPLSGRA